MNEIPTKFFLKDYITYFLEKNIGIYSKTEINNKLINPLLNLRFSEKKNNIIQNNSKSPYKIVMKKNNADRIKYYLYF